MRRPAAPLAAVAVTTLVYLGIAWIASTIHIPADVPTARTPWVGPFRVIASLGFAIASIVGVPHLAGNLVAALVLGGVLGAVFALTRRMVS